jgi:hypothetical protein
MSRVAVIPEFAAKKVEDTKFKADQIFAQPVSAAHGGLHKFVPFAIEDGDMVGAHGQVVLRMPTEHTVAMEKLPHRPRNTASLSPPVAVSLWVRK